MDNLSHSLAGLALAECVIARREARSGPVSRTWRMARSGPVSRTWRIVATLLAVVASNAPDLDLAVTSLTAGKLGYLLHHRGHTHTLLFVPLFAGFFLLAAALIARLRKYPWTQTDWRWLTVLTSAAALLHLCFDYLNSYGVHVFWPLDNRWSYGDTLFILEPSLWIALALPLLPGARSRVSQAALSLIVLVGLGLIAFSGFVPVAVGVVLGLLSVLLLWIAKRADTGSRGWLSLVAGAVLIATFALSSQRLRSLLSDEYAALVPNGRLHDLALTPMPANPLCWRVLAVSAEAEDYVLRDGLFSWRDVGTCPDMGWGGNPSLVPVTSWTPSRVHWRGEYRRPLAEIKALAAHCEIGGFLRFARTAVVSVSDTHLADIRFDRGGNDGFAVMKLVSGTPCPERVPPWEPPLAPLLR